MYKKFQNSKNISGEQNKKKKYHMKGKSFDSDVA
jgi:hypothetical protein